MMKVVSTSGTFHRSLVKKRVHLDEGLHLIHYKPAKRTSGTSAYNVHKDKLVIPN